MGFVVLDQKSNFLKWLELGPVKMRDQGDVGHLNEPLLEKVRK